MEFELDKCAILALGGKDNSAGRMPRSKTRHLDFEELYIYLEILEAYQT